MFADTVEKGCNHYVTDATGEPEPADRMLRHGLGGRGARGGLCALRSRQRFRQLLEGRRWRGLCHSPALQSGIRQLTDCKEEGGAFGLL